MESTGLPNKIQMSKAFKEALLAPASLPPLTARGLIEVKGKGMVSTWLLAPPGIPQDDEQEPIAVAVQDDAAASSSAAWLLASPTRITRRSPSPRRLPSLPTALMSESLESM